MENRKCRVNLVGIGMGSKGTLTEEVRKIIAESDVLIGAMRMLEGFREKKKCCYAEYLPEKIRAILDEQEKKTRCTVLFSTVRTVVSSGLSSCQARYRLCPVQ